MPSYCAFLGHQPAISLAEIGAYAKDARVERRYGNHVVIFRSERELGGADLARWGGTIVLGKRLSDGVIDLKDIPSVLLNEVSGMKGKVTFALRTHGLPPRTVRDLYKSTKERLRSAGRPARYVGNERVPAAAALLRDAGLLDRKHGTELIVLADEDDLWVGVTLAAHDPDSYTQRDIGKPVRDTTVGLLPPKLAQALLNFGEWLVRGEAAPPEGKRKGPPPLTVFDPFCGTGVIPMEALLRRWPVLASDVSLKAVNGTTKNIEWIRKIAGIPKKELPSDVWKQDATKKFEDLSATPDVVVTEGSLGPPLTARASLKDAQKLAREHQKLNGEFLRNVAESLPGVPVAMTWPVWYLRSGPVFLDLMGDVGKIGFTPALPPLAEPFSPDRLSLLYRRSDQYVGREIVLLKPQRS